MAWQLIYTSAPRGLVPGRSGFCTVARHREIRDGLVTAIERFSQYDRSGRGAGTPSPVVYAHRIVRLGGSSYHVLSCTRDAGADYTGRTNHLAHHLICEPHELAGAPSPAEVLQQMTWLRAWTDAPRYLGTEEVIDLGRFSPLIKLPAQEWQTVTRDAGCAALPLESGALSGCFWLYRSEAGEQHLLPLFAESLLLLDPSGRSAEKRWQVPFTTYLQSTDDAAEFVWRGCWHGSPAALAAQGARQTLDLTQPLRSPTSEAAELARTGRVATPTPPAAATPAEPEAQTTPIAPDARAKPRGGEIDLAELLASADQPGREKGPWARSKSATAAGASSVIPRSGPRRSPLKILIGAGAALVVAGVLATGFVMWRDGKAEAIAGELTGARNGGDFAKAGARAETISKIYRRYEPLRAEIVRTEVAVALDRLKDQPPAEAARYLTTQRELLGSATIQRDFSITDRLGKIARWSKMGESLEELRSSVAAETFRDANAADSLKKRFAEHEKSIAMLDAPYRSSVTKALAEVRRLYVQRRVEALENRSGPPPAGIELTVAELLRDAERFAAAPEWKPRIEQLYRPAPSAPPPPKIEAPEKPAGIAPAPPKSAAAATLPGVPAIPTYLAMIAPTGFDLSAIKEMQNGTAIPAEGKWQLIRAPEPLLTPENATAEECTIVGKKFYDAKTTELFTLQPPQLTMSAAAREALRWSALVRFSRPDGPAPVFQILLHTGALNSPAILRLPAAGAIVRTDRGSIKLAADWTEKFRVLRPAAAPNAVFVLRGSPVGLDPLHAEAGSVEQLELDLNADARRAAETVRRLQSKSAPGEIRLAELKAVEAARDYILKTEELANLGRTLYRGVTRKVPLRNKKGELELDAEGKQKYDFPPAMEKENSLASIDRFLARESDDAAKAGLDGGEAFVKYLSALLSFLPGFVENDGQRERVKEVGFKVQDMLKFPGPQAEKARKLWQITDSELPKIRSNPPAGGKRQPGADVFFANWMALFTEGARKHIQPFLEWSDGSVGKQVQELDKQLQPLRAELARTQAMTKRLEGDVANLGPWSIDLEFRNPPPVRVLRLVEFIEPIVEKKSEAAK